MPGKLKSKSRSLKRRASKHRRVISRKTTRKMRKGTRRRTKNQRKRRTMKGGMHTVPRVVARQGPPGGQRASTTAGRAQLLAQRTARVESAAADCEENLAEADAALSESRNKLAACEARCNPPPYSS